MNNSKINQILAFAAAVKEIDINRFYSSLNYAMPGKTNKYSTLKDKEKDVRKKSNKQKFKNRKINRKK